MFIQPVLSQTLEELSNTVAYLTKGSQSGTGFFIGNSDNCYLVTAAHVSKFMDEGSAVKIRIENDKSFSIPISGIVKGNGIPKWHENEKQDVAILNIDVSYFIEKFKHRMLPLSRFEQKLVAPKRERHLVVMGFPLSLGASGFFSPLTAESNSASGLLTIKSENGFNQTVFVIDKPSIEGYSGSPVFLMPWPFSDSAAITMLSVGSEEAKVKCVGIMVSTLSDSTGGKLGAIIPSYYIVELINEIESK